MVGSPQGDDIVGNGEFNRLDGGVGDDDLNGAGGPDEAFGGAGSDECDGFAAEHSCGAEENPPGTGTFVILNQGLDGSSLIVQGDARANDIHVSFTTAAGRSPTSGADLRRRRLRRWPTRHDRGQLPDQRSPPAWW